MVGGNKNAYVRLKNKERSFKKRFLQPLWFVCFPCCTPRPKGAKHRALFVQQCCSEQQTNQARRSNFIEFFSFLLSFPLPPPPPPPIVVGSSSPQLLWSGNQFCGGRGILRSVQRDGGAHAGNRVGGQRRHQIPAPLHVALAQPPPPGMGLAIKNRK